MLTDSERAPFRTGHTLATTIYRGDEKQPCAWIPNDPELAALIVRLLNSQHNAAVDGLKARIANG